MEEGKKVEGMGNPADAGLRYDDNKLRVDLIPPQWIEGLAKVFTMGAKKYGDHNWKKGMKYSRMLASMQRHMLNWQKGEKMDGESELNPLLHVAWNALALVYYEDHWMVKWDDREFKEVNLLTAEEVRVTEVYTGYRGAL